jgi:hypothetical protein
MSGTLLRIRFSPEGATLRASGGAALISVALLLAACGQTGAPGTPDPASAGPVSPPAASGSAASPSSMTGAAAWTRNPVAAGTHRIEPGNPSPVAAGGAGLAPDLASSRADPSGTPLSPTQAIASGSVEPDSAATDSAGPGPIRRPPVIIVRPGMPQEPVLNDATVVRDVLR